MRKLKLQVQMSVNGYIAGPKGELDWLTWEWDDALKNYVNNLTDSVDTILLGRKMAEGFINYWTDVVKNKADSEEYPFAKKMVDYHKVVFTNTLDKSNWENTRIAKDLIAEVKKIKQNSGKDIIVYGGASFVSSLIDHDMIDEYHLFINPVVLGEGLTIFNGRKNLKKINSTAFECGVVVSQYQSE